MPHPALRQASGIVLNELLEHLMQTKIRRSGKLQAMREAVKRNRETREHLTAQTAHAANR